MEAVDAVLRENLFGLELDPVHPDRRVRPGAGGVDLPGPDGQPLGHRPLPTVEHRLLGAGSRRVEGGLGEVRQRRRSVPRGDGAALRPVPQRPDLGSLADPRTVAEDLFALGFDTLKGTVEPALKKIEAREIPTGRPSGSRPRGLLWRPR